MSIARRTWPGSEVTYALLARGAQGVTAVLASVGVVWQFSLDQQALFFVFVSLGALIQWGDVGLTYAVLQTAGDVARAGRFGAFQRQARRIGQVLLLTVSVLVGAFGTLLMAQQVHGLWFGPWWAFSVAAAAAQYMQLELAFIEGARSVSQAWRIRFAQELVGGAAFITALIAGAGLWSLCVYWGLRAALATVWLGLSGAWVSPADPPYAPFSWRAQVWPFQWRIGLSGLSGFLIFQAFNPILLVEQGSAAAATFGMSLAIMNMLLLVTTAWPLSQASHYGALLAEGHLRQIRQRFWRTLTGSTVLATLIAAAVVLVMHWMKQNSVGLVNRFADIPTTVLLLSAAMVHHVTLCLAVLLRAERRDPLLQITVFGGLLTVGVVWLAARLGNPHDVALVNLACTLLGLIIAMRHYRHFALRVLTASSREASIHVAD